MDPVWARTISSADTDQRRKVRPQNVHRLARKPGHKPKSILEEVGERKAMRSPQN